MNHQRSKIKQIQRQSFSLITIYVGSTSSVISILFSYPCFPGLVTTLIGGMVIRPPGYCPDSAISFRTTCRKFHGLSFLKRFNGNNGRRLTFLQLSFSDSFCTLFDEICGKIFDLQKKQFKYKNDSYH